MIRLDLKSAAIQTPLWEYCPSSHVIGTSPMTVFGRNSQEKLLCYTSRMASSQATLPGASPRKKLFLVDAMAHVYRAFFAPMNRMNAPSGIPTKVTFLFNTILRRLLNDYKPDYVAIVFDTRKPTFRDQLFEKYKAKRQPMPDELS